MAKKIDWKNKWEVLRANLEASTRLQGEYMNERNKAWDRNKDLEESVRNKKGEIQRLHDQINDREELYKKSLREEEKRADFYKGILGAFGKLGQVEPEPVKHQHNINIGMDAFGGSRPQGHGGDGMLGGMYGG